MATVDELSVKFGADFRELLAEMKRSEQATAEFRGKVEKEMNVARVAFDRIGGEIRGVFTGALASIQTAGITAAIGLLTAAFISLSEGTSKAKAAMDAANAALATGKKLGEELATVTGEVAEQKKVEAFATIALTESEITRMQIVRERLREEERGARSAQTQLSAAARGEIIDKQIEKIKEQIKFTKLSIAAGEEAAHIAAGMRTSTGGRTDKPPTAPVGMTKGESWLVREAQAAIQASEALEEYKRRTADARALAEAELSGNRVRIAQIELEQQLRKQYGTDFVKNHQDRIAAYAAERAEVDRNIEQQRRLVSELQALGGTVKSALGDSLIAAFDRTGNAAEKMRQIWANAFEDMSRRLLNFALDQAWQLLLRNIMGMAGGLSGAHESAHGGAGGIGSFLGGLLGGIGKLVGFAEGGRPRVGVPSLVGERGPELFIPDVPGTIMPNHRGGVGGGGGGRVTYIDARGADQAAVARLEAIVRAQGSALRAFDAGFYDRAVGSVYDARRRGYGGV